MSKRKKFFGFMLLAVMVLVGAVIAYTAPTIDLAKTGQTTSYYAGDDGALQKGTAWPSPRFTCYNTSNVVVACSDGTRRQVQDNLTGLIWAYNGNSPAVTGGGTDCNASGGRTWQGALKYVKCANTANHYSNNTWRLPNVLELNSLFNEGYAGSSALWLNANGFVNMKDTGTGHYWAGTTYGDQPVKAWAVNFSTLAVVSGGDSADTKTNKSYYTLPVRGGS